MADNTVSFNSIRDMAVKTQESVKKWSDDSVTSASSWKVPLIGVHIPKGPFSNKEKASDAQRVQQIVDDLLSQIRDNLAKFAKPVEER